MTNDVVGLMPLAAKIARYANLKETAVFDRDEATAVAYMGLVEADRSYDPTRGATFKTFAAKKARWAIFGAYRAQYPFAHETFKESEYIAFVEISTLEDTDWEGKHAVFLEGYEYLGDLLALLTPRERFAITAKYWHGLTGTDIAKRLGVDQTGVNHSLRTALQKMKTALVVDASRLAGGKARC